MLRFLTAFVLALSLLAGPSFPAVTAWASSAADAEQCRGCCHQDAGGASAQKCPCHSPLASCSGNAIFVAALPLSAPHLPIPPASHWTWPAAGGAPDSISFTPEPPPPKA